MEFDILDIIIPLFYSLFFLFGAFIYQNTQIKTKQYYKYFTIGLFLKIVGGISFALVYKYYYGGGDTFAYYQGAEVLFDLFTTSPKLFFRTLFLSAREFDPLTLEYTNKVWFFNHSESWFLIKIASVLNIFAFNSYMGTTILFSLISFVGSWQFYKTMVFLYPNLYEKLAIAAFYIPSVIFWGSGIMKDTITLASIGFLFYATIQIIDKFKFYYLPVLIFHSYIILNLKAYILISYAISALLYFYWVNTKKITNHLLKVIATPILIVFIISFGVFIIPSLMNNTQKYKVDEIEERVEGFQSWHTTLAERGGSGYSLGETQLTPIGILKKVPASINVTLFRPYLWEAKNAVNVLAAFESLFFLLFTLRVLIKTKFVLKNNSEEKFLLAFSLFLAFIVGFTAYNFGALMRFKIPLMSFYYSYLIVKSNFHRA